MGEALWKDFAVSILAHAQYFLVWHFFYVPAYCILSVYFLRVPAFSAYSCISYKSVDTSGRGFPQTSTPLGQGHMSAYRKRRWGVFSPRKVEMSAVEMAALPEVYAATREVMRKGQTSRAKVMRKWVGAPSAGANVMRAHFLAYFRLCAGLCAKLCAGAKCYARGYARRLVQEPMLCAHIFYML